jgi:hypothetical protein
LRERIETIVYKNDEGKILTGEERKKIQGVSLQCRKIRPSFLPSLDYPPRTYS